MPLIENDELVEAFAPYAAKEAPITHGLLGAQTFALVSVAGREEVQIEDHLGRDVRAALAEVREEVLVEPVRCELVQGRDGRHVRGWGLARDVRGLALRQEVSLPPCCNAIPRFSPQVRKCAQRYGARAHRKPWPS